MRKVNEINWSDPGRNRYVGPVDKAINSYEDIPKHIREQLVDKANRRDYSEIVVIDLTGIRGPKWEYVNLRQMFFGMSTRGEIITRHNWSPWRIERGFVYTIDNYSVLIPFVCGNVSRVDHQPRTSEPYVPPTSVPLELFKVPEPSSLSLITLALGFIIHRRQLNRQK